MATAIPTHTPPTALQLDLDTQAASDAERASLPIASASMVQRLETASGRILGALAHDDGADYAGSRRSTFVTPRREHVLMWIATGLLAVTSVFFVLGMIIR